MDAKEYSDIENIKNELEAKGLMTDLSSVSGEKGAYNARLSLRRAK
jgi:type II secretory pathway component PulL